MFADTIKIACPVSSVTDSTLPQSAIDSSRGQCAADFMYLNTDETKIISTVLTTYGLMKQMLGTICTLTCPSTTDCL